MASPMPSSVPKSLLGRHRILAPAAAVKVSPLCLGAMNFGNLIFSIPPLNHANKKGDAWKNALGECSKETAFEILDFFYSQGGNFIDTAVNYQFGESEQWLGEWMEARGNRDEMVIATKFTGNQVTHLPHLILSNFGGNNAKNIHTSVERSLKHLKTSYIDLVKLSSSRASQRKRELMISSTTSTSGTPLRPSPKSCTPSTISAPPAK
jgi:aryl-alcohol dehydrogenase-like predicted oxidoreductase